MVLGIIRHVVVHLGDVTVLVLAQFKCGAVFSWGKVQLVALGGVEWSPQGSLPPFPHLSAAVSLPHSALQGKFWGRGQRRLVFLIFTPGR